MADEAVNISRRVRQALETDRLLGMADVPIGRLTLIDEAEQQPSLSPAVSVSAPLLTAATASIGRAATPPPMTFSGNKATSLAALEQHHNTTCPLCVPLSVKLKFVFGEGDPDAAIMFVGEGPGEDEDRLGRPFVGKAGQLLNKQIAAMGLRREQVYIANIVKTRPPNNRVPTPEEAEACKPYLEQQIDIIAPRVIVALGATAAKYLLNDPNLAITRERGNWKTYRGVALMPTFHPAYLLRQYTVQNRQRVWDDLKKVMQHVGLPLPKSPGA